MNEDKSAGKRSGPPPIVYILVLLIGAGALWNGRNQLLGLLGSPPSLPGLPQGLPSLPGQNPQASAFPPPTAVPAGIAISIDLGGGIDFAPLTSILASSNDVFLTSPITSFERP